MEIIERSRSAGKVEFAIAEYGREFASVVARYGVGSEQGIEIGFARHTHTVAGVRKLALALLMAADLAEKIAKGQE